MNKNWSYVVIAGLLEIIWATGLKYADSWYAWLGTFIVIYLSFVVLLKATEALPVATVYAVFTGIGAAGTVIVETVLFGETLDGAKLFWLLLLMSGVIGLKLVTAEPKEEVKL